MRGLRVLDVGCGSGAKALALAGSGAAHVTGVDVSGVFVEHQCRQVELVQGDLSDLAAVPGLAEDRFDRILFFQSISYSRDQRQTLVDARTMLADGGTIIVQRSHPIRFAVERAEANGTSMGHEYYSTESYAYRSGWNPAVTLTHSTETFSDMLNTFAAAGLTVDAAVEPQLSADDRVRYPHKQASLDKYLGVILLTLSAR